MVAPATFTSTTAVQERFNEVLVIPDAARPLGVGGGVTSGPALVLAFAVFEYAESPAALVALTRK